MDADLISLVETQINIELLELRSAATNNLFRSEAHFCIMNNNSNELIGCRQQGRVLLSVYSQALQILRGSGYDITNLSR